MTSKLTTTARKCVATLSKKSGSMEAEEYVQKLQKCIVQKSSSPLNERVGGDYNSITGVVNGGSTAYNLSGVLAGRQLLSSGGSIQSAFDVYKLYLMPDGQIIIKRTDGQQRSSTDLASPLRGPNSDSNWSLFFTSAGNLELRYKNIVMMNSNTAGTGAYSAGISQDDGSLPDLQVKNQSYQTLWSLRATINNGKMMALAWPQGWSKYAGNAADAIMSPNGRWYAMIDSSNLLRVYDKQNSSWSKGVPNIKPALGDRIWTLQDDGNICYGYGVNPWEKSSCLWTSTGYIALVTDSGMFRVLSNTGFPILQF